MDKIPVPNDIRYRGVLLDTEAIKYSTTEGNKNTVLLSFAISLSLLWYLLHLLPAPVDCCCHSSLLHSHSRL